MRAARVVVVASATEGGTNHNSGKADRILADSLDKLIRKRRGAGADGHVSTS